MKMIHIEDHGAIETIVEQVRHEAVLLQLTTVYALVSAPTQRGVEQLNALKDRLSGKNYGTLIGRADRFIEQALPGALPESFNSAEQLEEMCGAFVRTAFTDSNFDSPVIRAGTHQGLLLEGAHRELFCRVEEDLASDVDRDLWNGCEVSSLLGTSANLSGDPLGSITDFERAEQFARDRGVGLFVRCETSIDEKGSYPILEFAGNQVSVHRDGPGLERLIGNLPSDMRQTLAA